jgi:O-antigen/teichoic acid export membrane protein
MQPAELRDSTIIDDVLDSQGAGAAAIRGGSVRIVGYAAGALVSLVAMAILLRHLGPEAGGRFVTVQAIAALAAGVTDGGLAGIAVREYAVLRGAEREAAQRSLLGIRILLTLGGTVGAMIFTAVAGYGPTLVFGCLLASLALLFNGLQNSLATPLNAQLKMGPVALVDVLRQVLAGVMVVALVLAGGGIVVLLTANFVGGAMAMVVMALIVRGTMPLRPSLHVRQWGSMLVETLPYAAATAVSAVYFRFAIILVSLIASAEQTGYFAASFRGVEVLLVVPQLLVGAAFPIFSRAARDDHARLSLAIGRVFDVMLLLGIVVALGLFFGAPFVIRVVAGPDFAPAADVLRWHGLSLLASFVGGAWAYGALSLRRHHDVLLTTIVALFTTVVLTSILTATHAAVGAAAGTAIAEWVLTAGMGISVMRGGVSLAPDLQALPRVALAAVVSLWPLLLGMDEAGQSLAAAALSIGTFVVVAVGLRAVPPELIDIARRRRHAG